MPWSLCKALNREYLQFLAPCARDININGDVMALYLDQLLPGITVPGDDGNYGSAACYDVLCLQVALNPQTWTFQSRGTTAVLPESASHHKWQQFWYTSGGLCWWGGCCCVEDILPCATCCTVMVHGET